MAIHSVLIVFLLIAVDYVAKNEAMNVQLVQAQEHKAMNDRITKLEAK